MALGFEVLGYKHLEWLRNLRNQNSQWFMDSRQINEPEMQELWFRLSSRSGDLNLIIKDGVERIGFISVYNVNEGIANIGRMMIDDRFKHQGYMELAIIRVFEITKRYLQIEELRLEVKDNNVIARDLYVKMGFITYGITAETLIMRKMLYLS